MTRELPQDLRPIVAFHGHVCPGLLIGYRAAKAAMAHLGIDRARDEEFVAIVENDACGVDAVQYLTGATFGKGNLIFRDLGKQAFSFFARDRGTSVRVVLKRDAIGDEERTEIRRRQAHAASDEERAAAHADAAAARERAIDALLTKPDEELFWFKDVQEDVPPGARVLPTVTCTRCGEGVMESRLVVRDGECVCLRCAEDLGAPTGPT